MIQLGGTRTRNTMMMTTMTTTLRIVPKSSQSGVPYIPFSSGVSKSPSEALSTLIGWDVVGRSLSVAISTLIGRRVVGKPPSVA